MQLQELSSQFNKNLKGCGGATNQPTEGKTAGERARHRQREREVAADPGVLTLSYLDLYVLFLVQVPAAINL